MLNSIKLKKRTIKKTNGSFPGFFLSILSIQYNSEESAKKAELWGVNKVKNPHYN